MAYNSRYNPDALPAHAEPDQAAAMLSGQSGPGGGRPHGGSVSAANQPAPAPYNKPQPPIPQQSRPAAQQHAGPPSPYGAGYGGGGVGAGAGYGPPGPPQGHGGQGQHVSPLLPPAGGRYHGHSPPPADYGNGPPPSNHGRPPVNYRPPPSPMPPPIHDGGDGSLLPLFRAVDKDGSGRLSERELGSALVNGDFSAFDPQTVRMMIRMFDTDKTGSISYQQFQGLWGFLAAWRGLFERFDIDKSNSITYDEYTKALVAFGYRLSPGFVHILFSAFDKRKENAMSFDLFVQSCISLKRMTDVFRRLDEDRDGYITISFEEFLTGACPEDFDKKYLLT